MRDLSKADYSLILKYLLTSRRYCFGATAIRQLHVLQRNCQFLFFDPYGGIIPMTSVLFIICRNRIYPMLRLSNNFLHNHILQSLELVGSTGLEPVNLLNVSQTFYQLN